MPAASFREGASTVRDNLSSYQLRTQLRRRLFSVWYNVIFSIHIHNQEKCEANYALLIHSMSEKSIAPSILARVHRLYCTNILDGIVYIVQPTTVQKPSNSTNILSMLTIDMRDS